MTEGQKYTTDMLQRLAKSFVDTVYKDHKSSPDVLDLGETITFLGHLNENNLVLVDTKKDGERVQQKLEALQRQAGTFQYGEQVVPVNELGPLFGKR